MSSPRPTEPITVRTTKENVARIEEGMAAAREGRVIPAESVFGAIAAKQGWQQ